LPARTRRRQRPRVGGRRVLREALPAGAAAAATAAAAVAAVSAIAVLALSRGQEEEVDKASSDAEPEDIGSAEPPPAVGERLPVAPELEEALRDFDGDFRGPWLALGLDPDVDFEASLEEIRTAYRSAVRLEHPDTSEETDAKDRFRRVRKAYALLGDEGMRALLLEAMEREVESLEELASEPEEKSSSAWVRGALVLGLALGLGGAWLQLGSEGKLRFTADRKRREAEGLGTDVLVMARRLQGTEEEALSTAGRLQGLQRLSGS